MNNRLWLSEPPRTTHPLKFLWFASTPYRGWALFAFFCIITSSVVSIFTPYSFKLIVDAAHAYVNGSSADPLWRAAGLFILVSLTSITLWRVGGFGVAFWGAGARATARYALSAYLSLHSHKYFSSRFTGALASKVDQAASAMRDMVTTIIWQFSAFIVTIISSFVLAYLTSPILAWIFLAWVAVVIPVNLYFAKKRVPVSVAAQRSQTKLSGATVDMLTNMLSVHEYARRSYELERLKELNDERRRLGLKNWLFGDAVLLGNGLLEILFIAGIILTSIYLMTSGAVSPGDVVLMLTIVYLVQDRIAFIGQAITSFSETWGVVRESLSDILEKHEVTDAKGAGPLLMKDGSVALEDVSFSYGGAKIFEKFSLLIPSGQKVGLVGRSGAGKSTLTKLLLRHYDLDAGAIRLGGADIAMASKETVRERIAMVPQEPMLFHRSIRDNIAYGKPTATEEEIIAAAKAAQAHEFIETLPEGYESLVGERGVKLSGGQRQRVVLARAFLKDAPVLVLDEATSSLDSESEVAIQKALLAIMQGRTVIAIAHRLSTLRAMDRIIVMDGGAIVEDGTHEELLEKNGLYASLWNHQAGGFITEE